MNSLQKINNIAKLEYFLPTKPMKDLNINYKYVVTDIKRIHTQRFGEQIIITIQNEFNVYLPSRVTQYLIENQNDFDELKTSIDGDNPVFFIYLNGQFLSFEFITKEN